MDKNELVKTAALAKLKLNEKERGKLATEVSVMLENFSLMMKADIEGIKPTTQILQQKNRTRRDEANLVPRDNLSNEILNEAHEIEDRFIVIPHAI